MTCGIYILYFNCEDAQYYIGKSFDIDLRVKEHCSALKSNRHYNKALTKGYSLYGPPASDILEVLPRDNETLFSREVYWIKHFDSFYSGMNETIGGKGWGQGEERPSSVYTDEQVIEVFNLLVSSVDLTYRDISQQTKVSVNTIASIASCFTHTWLENRYPVEYLKLKNLVGTRKSNRSSAASRGISYPSIRSPDNRVYNVTNIAAFSREHHLGKEKLGRVLRGIDIQHKGWKLA